LSHQKEEITVENLKLQRDQAAKARSYFKSHRLCSKRFGLVVLLGGLLATQDIVSEYGVMGPRKKYFTDEWMKENFE